jgi:hypothetical protein
VVTKNTAAKTAVVRDKKLAPPVAPNKLPELPLPKAAPMSAPLPCCTKINPIMAKADNICTAKITVIIAFMLRSKSKYLVSKVQAALGG